MSAAWAQKGRKAAAVRLKTEMIQFCSETRSTRGRRMISSESYVDSSIRQGDSLNSAAIVGNAAATMVVSSACSVNGANKPSTIFHRYERRRRFSAFSSGVGNVVVVVVGGLAGEEEEITAASGRTSSTP